MAVDLNTQNRIGLLMAGVLRRGKSANVLYYRGLLADSANYIQKMHAAIVIVLYMYGLPIACCQYVITVKA